MTIPRKELVDTSSPGFYHITNRCVRRTFLCGFDKETGMDYSHRKVWLEERIKYLASIFSIDIYAFAIMDNHYHIVLYLDPLLPQTWSDKDIAEKWLMAYPSKQHDLRKQTILNNPNTLKKYRKRLGNLSWFMRRLNEPLAKLSNREEGCNGRFWQGRYHSQALLDEAAVISCMAYVDLNPVRAKITEKLEESNHTSIQERIYGIEKDKKTNSKQLQKAMQSVCKENSSSLLSIKLIDYIELVEWTGQAIVHPNKASIPEHIIPILEKLNLQQHHWLKQVQTIEEGYTHFIGSIQSIRQKAQQLKKRFLRGISSAKLFYIHPG